MKINILILPFFILSSLCYAQIDTVKDAVPVVKEEAFKDMSTHELVTKVLEINLRVNQIMLKIDGGDKVIEEIGREINQEISNLQKIQKIITLKPEPKESEIKEFSKFLIAMNREVTGLKKRLPIILSLIHI